MGQNSSWKSKSLDLCLTMLSLQRSLERCAGEPGVMGNHPGMTKLKWWPQKEKDRTRFKLPWENGINGTWQWNGSRREILILRFISNWDLHFQ